MFDSRASSMTRRFPPVWAAALSVAWLAGCGPTFRDLRLAGQQQVAKGNWGAARNLLHEAMTKVPEDPENLHDLGVCATMLARQEFQERNHAAAMRDVDRAIDYYTRSIGAYPGFRSSILGKNRAQELKGQFEDALRTAHWAARYVGPSAEQFLFLGAEYEERGDLDAALLRYRQAVAIEPNSARAHRALGLLHRRAGNREAAIAELDRSLELDPTQADVAEALRALGEPVPMVDLGPDE